MQEKSSEVEVIRVNDLLNVKVEEEIIDLLQGFEICNLTVASLTKSYVQKEEQIQEG